MVVVVTDDHGHIVLQRRRDNDLWALPGGGMDFTDSLPGTAVCEVEITGLVGTYTDPKHVIVYTKRRGSPPVQRLFHRLHHRRPAGDLRQVHRVPVRTAGRDRAVADASHSRAQAPAPSLATMRERFWKNEVAEPGAADQYGAAN